MSVNTPEAVASNRFIEVKAISTAGFFWSKNEYAVAKLLGTNYYLYLVDLTKISNNGYSPEIVNNPAQAIMENPQVLILDEPFNGLDRNGAAQMRELLKELKQQGKSMLLASHNAQDIRELCDRVHDMEDIWKTEELG